MANDLARWQFATTSDLSLLLRPGDDRAGVPGRDPADRLVPHRQPRLQADDALLRDAAADQRGHRRGHRAGPGVRVRDELVDLLALRRRRVRSAAGDGGPGSRSSSSRRSSGCGCSAGTGSPSGCTWRAIWAVSVGIDAVGDVHPRRQLVDAAPGRLQAQQGRPAGAEQRLGAVRQPDVRVGLRPRDPRVAGHRLSGDARRLGLVPAQAASTSSRSIAPRRSR